MDGSNGGRKKGSMNEEWFLSCDWIKRGVCECVQESVCM